MNQAHHHEATMNALSWVITVAPFVTVGARIAVNAMKKKKARAK